MSKINKEEKDLLEKIQSFIDDKDFKLNTVSIELLKKLHLKWCVSIGKSSPMEENKGFYMGLLVATKIEQKR